MRLLRGGLVPGLVLALALMLAPLPATSAGAEAGPVRRVGSGDRYATAAALSFDAFPAGAATAYVATGEGFADALAAGPVAALDSAPILLVRPNDLPAATAEELQRLRPDRIVVLGGEAAVSPTVAEQLAGFAPVTRRSGEDRYATAVAVSSARFTPGGETVFIATGAGFADALAAGPVAARRQAPILLVGPGSVPPVVAAELRRLRPASITVLGGTAAVPDAVVSELRSLTTGAVRRVAGADRYATSAALSQEGFPQARTVVFVTGTAFADALASAPLAARLEAPVLLVASNCLAPTVAEEVSRLGAPSIVVAGGPGAVAHTVERLVGCPKGSPFTLTYPSTATTDELAFLFRSTTVAQDALGDSGPLTLNVLDEVTAPLSVVGLARFGFFNIYLPTYRPYAARTGESWAFNVVAHEYFHTLQFSLSVAAGGTPTTFLIGPPVWLQEGPANHFALELQAARYPEFALGSYRRALVGLSRQTPARLSSLLTPEDIYGRTDTDPRYAKIILAGQYLAETYGEPALKELYWSELGRSGSWTAAFSQVFGVPVAQFYDDFEHWREQM